MLWHKAAIAGLIVFCLSLLGVAAIQSGTYFSDYRRDIEYNKEYCASEENAEERHNSKECQSVLYRTFDDPIALLTASLTVATIALFIVTFGLYAAASRQGADAKEAVAISRETSQTQLRAYLSVDSAMIHQMTGRSDLIINLQIKNFGQTPAYKVRTCIRTAYAPRDADPYDSERVYGSQSIVGPSAGIELQDVRPLTPEKLDTVIAGHCRIFVWGTVLYEDAFGQERYFEFEARSGGAQLIYSNDGVTTRATFALMPSPSGYKAN